MSSDAEKERVNTLLAKAEGQVSAGNLQAVSEAWKEASHLAGPEDERVKKVWLLLQKLEAGRSAVELLRLYLGSKDEVDGKKALQELQQKQLSSDDADAAITLLLDADNALSLTDQLLGTLINRHVEVRKVLATKLSECATELFEQIHGKGDSSFNAFSSVPLDDALWTSSDAHRTAQRDIFRLCLAELMEAGEEHLERPMRAIARQLAAKPENVSDIVDEDMWEVILSSLDIRLPQSLRSQSLVATSKLLEAKGEDGERAFSSFVTSKVGKQTNDDLTIAFSAAAACFPVVPAIAAKLFMTDGFVQQLVPHLEQNSADAAAGRRKSRTLEQAALELFSAACVDKACRSAIDKHCAHWLATLMEERQGTHKALASLVLAKVKGDSPDTNIATKLSNMVLQSDSESDQAIEGLAYTSLQPKVKEVIVANPALVKCLVTALKDRPTLSFGCLTVFANVTAYRPPASDEQKKMAQLKAYANQTKPAEQDPLDNNGKVTARCKKVLEADVVPAIVTCCKQSTSPSIIALAVQILLSLSREQKHRAKMAQQGAIKLLLQIRDRLAKTDKATSSASSIERDASHALARLLISVNPSHVFSAGLPASSAVSALVPLLSLDQESEERNLLPTFEALLALTNLASMEDNSVRDLQLRLAWEPIENQLLLSSNTMIQRASVELVCNLMASPSCVAKFADGSKQAGQRMHILLALADVEDFATRRAAGGALAMLTEWDAAVSAVLEKERGVKIVLGMCGDESEEMRHRGLAVLLNVVSAPGDVGAKGLEKVKAANGAELVKDALRKTKNTEILGLGVEVLKKLA